MPNVRSFRSAKAISPILATLLLIVIAVAAIVVTYAWIMTYMGSTTNQAGVMLTKENVRFYGTPTDADKNLMELRIGNSGTSTARIVRIYMGNSSGGEIELTTYSDIGSGKALEAGQVISIILNWPNTLATNWESLKTYYIKVVPAQGQFLETTEQAP